jgi:GNAT superfamily N-acetyltransferase
MNIVKASVVDAKAIAEIISASNKDVADEFGLNRDNNPKHPSFCTQDWVIGDFERGEEYFIYKKEGVSIGCVAFENPRPGIAYLNRLSVLPDYRHEGVGAELVKHVFAYAKSKQIQNISIGIIAKHTKLKNWYKKLGFVEGDVKRFPHLPFDVQYMRFELVY